VDPHRPNLAAEVLDWFADAAGGEQRTVTVMDTDRQVTATLAARGYHPLRDRPFFTHCVRNLDATLPPVHVPDGYRVRAVRPDEAALRAAAHRAAWRPARIGRMLVPPQDLGDAPSGMTTDRYQAVMNTWPYRPDLDRVVEAPDGTLAAFALGWLDDVNQVGELEPVGTDPGHSRRGLGAAGSLACLHAPRAAGATRAVVYPRGDGAYPVPGHLYHRIGFRPTARTVTHGRHASAGA
jgi:ribosomal protein S18 acetylase RimI-like enzyme